MHANRIPYQVKQVRLGKTEHRSPEFLKINPLGKVPVIVDGDGSVVFESHSIVRRLTSRYKVEPHWYAPGHVDLQRHLAVEQYLDFHHLGVRNPLTRQFFLSRFLPMITGQPTDPAVIADAARTRVRALQELENSPWFRDPAAKGGPYLLGAQPSVADIFCFCEVEQTALLALPFVEGGEPSLREAAEFAASNEAKYPKICAWFKEVRKLDGYAESHEVFSTLVGKAFAAKTAKL